MIRTACVATGRSMKAPLTFAADHSRFFILAAVCLSALVLPLSFSGGAVATLAISDDLGGSATELTWITNAFMLSFGSLLMAAGSLADRFGRKRVFSTGVALFSITSLALSFAPSVISLDILRALQGVAAAAALAGGSAALAQEFEGHSRTRAFSMLGTTFGIGLAFGPLIAGGLIETFGWRSIFLTTSIIGVLSLVFGVPRMRESKNPVAIGMDWPGLISFSGMLVLFTFGIIQAPASGWTSIAVVSALTGSAALLITFVVAETRATRPMLDLSLFRYLRFIGVQMLPIGTCYCYIVLVVMLPARFIGIEGLREIEAGWLMVALSAPLLVVPIIAASLARWISAGILCGVGFLIAAAGLYWFSLIDIGAPRLLILPMLLIGIGAGLPWGLMDALSISVVPKERAGMAAGIFNTAKVAGEGISLAIVTAVLAALAHTSLTRIIPSIEPTTLKEVAEVAQRIAAGDILRAQAMLPGIDQSILLDSYGESFRQLLHFLISMTVLSALTSFGLLSGGKSDPERVLGDVVVPDR